MKFVPMYDLASMTEEQRQEYYRDACAFYGVPAELNLLAFIYMDTGDGAQNQVLYAKKGATDRIRDNRGITTIDLIGPSMIGGSVVFTAVGQNKDGRVERAVGAAAVEGLHGQNLAKAIMTAQTRATRRMTLQFVGGLLDESEVHNTTVSISQANIPLSEIAAQPPAPNNAPGRLVVVNEYQEPAPGFRLQPLVPDVSQIETPIIPAEATEFLKVVQGAAEKISGEVEAALKPRRKRTPESANADIPAKSSLGDITVVQGVINPLTQAPTVSQPAAVALPVPASAPQPAIPAVEAKPVEPPAPEAPKANMPTPEQQKAYRARWTVYVNQRLSKEGKMVPTEGIGGVSTKLRRFVKHVLPETSENEALTVKQWETILGYLDGKYESVGAKGLVKFIDGLVCK